MTADSLDRSEEAPTAGAASRLLTIPVWIVRSGLVAIVLTYTVMLNAMPLAEPDEVRYAEIPREMVERGDWVTPHLNYVKYFEKPPLLYWLTALSVSAFGTRPLANRLPLAALALATIGVAYVLGQRIYGVWTGTAAAAVLAATPLFFGLSQFLTLDMALSAWMALALAAFWFAYENGNRRRIYLLAFYIATALALLTKGPVAVVLNSGVIIVFLLLQRDLAALRWVVSPVGIALFSIIALPWFALVSARNPEFLDYFVVDQHFLRFLRPSEHQQPIWFFVPILLAGTLPWSALVLSAPASVALLVRRLFTPRVARGTLFLTAWCVVVFGFFSLSGSKLGTYILPMLCPFAILMARFIEHQVRDGRAATLRRGYWFACAIGAGAVLGALATPLFIDDSRTATITSYLVPTGCVLFATAVLALWLSRNVGPIPGLATFWIGMLIMQVVVISGRSVVESYWRLGVAVHANARPDDLVVAYKHYVQSLTYYGQRRVVQVDAWGELDFGRTQGDQRAFFWPSADDLLAAWSSERHMFLVINRSELEPLLAQMQPTPRLIAAQGKKVLLANFPGPWQTPR